MAQHAPSSASHSGGGGGGDPGRLNPAALSVADAARVLTRLGGGEVTEAMLRADIDAGAPTNTDDTMNLIHYAAWLVKEMARGED